MRFAVEGATRGQACYPEEERVGTGTAQAWFHLVAMV